MIYDTTLPYPRDLIGYGQNPPHAQWPGGARIAVQFVLNYEEGGENAVLHGDAGSEQFLSEMFNPASYPERHMSMEGIYEYGARAGVWRILREFEQRGLPLTVLHDESLSFQQGPRLTDLARRCFAQVGADFVFPLDGDEFLRTESRTALERALLQVPAGCCGKIPWQTYVASDSDDSTEVNPVRRMRHRVAEDDDAIGETRESKASIDGHHLVPRLLQVDSERT